MSTFVLNPLPCLQGYFEWTAKSFQFSDFIAASICKIMSILISSSFLVIWLVIAPIFILAVSALTSLFSLLFGLLLYLLQIKFNILNIQTQSEYFQLQHMEKQVQHETFQTQPGNFSCLLTFKFNTSLSNSTHPKLGEIIEENHS